MKFGHNELRDAVLSYIRSTILGSNPNPQISFQFLRRLGDGTRVPDDDDWEATRQIFYQLSAEGIIVPGTRISADHISSSHLLDWPFFQVTEYGKKILSGHVFEPHDPERYLDALRLLAPKVDKETLRYLSESLQCFRNGTLLASAVMLGAASENALLQLIETFGKWIKDPKDGKDFHKETDTLSINRKYSALWSRLRPLAKSLPPELEHGLESLLDRTFDLIRTTRNDAGHPQGRIITREEMRANISVFPPYCQRVFALIDHFQ